MAYRLKRGESVPEGIRRIAREELDSVVEQLKAARSGNSEEAVHEARKSVKKVRALLRLVRGELGDAYDKETRGLREAGRKLSEIRDATAVIEILDRLKEKFPQEAGESHITWIRNALAARRRHAKQDASLPKALAAMADSIRRSAKRAKGWPIETNGFPAIRAGLKETFRSGRKAFARARRQPRPENYHAWRKRVKDHWYHVRLLEGVWGDVMRGYEQSLKDLETWLGDDHNLVLLRERLLAGPESYGGEKAVENVLGMIGQYQKELRENAVSLGRRIYQQKPGRFAKRMEQLWDEWQAEPKSLEELEKKQRHQQQRRSA